MVEAAAPSPDNAQLHSKRSAVVLASAVGVALAVVGKGQSIAEDRRSQEVVTVSQRVFKDRRVFTRPELFFVHIFRAPSVLCAMFLCSSCRASASA